MHIKHTRARALMTQRLNERAIYLWPRFNFLLAVHYVVYEHQRFHRLVTRIINRVSLTTIRRFGFKKKHVGPFPSRHRLRLVPIDKTPRVSRSLAPPSFPAGRNNHFYNDCHYRAPKGPEIETTARNRFFEE